MIDGPQYPVNKLNEDICFSKCTIITIKEISEVFTRRSMWASYLLINVINRDSVQYLMLVGDPFEHLNKIWDGIVTSYVTFGFVFGDFSSE